MRIFNAIFSTILSIASVTAVAQVPSDPSSLNGAWKAAPASEPTPQTPGTGPAIALSADLGLIQLHLPVNVLNGGTNWAFIIAQIDPQGVATGPVVNLGEGYLPVGEAVITFTSSCDMTMSWTLSPSTLFNPTPQTQNFATSFKKYGCLPPRARDRAAPVGEDHD